MLLKPIDSPAVVRSGVRAATAVINSHDLLGVGRTEHSIEARRWLNAAGDLRDKVVEIGARGVQLGRRLGAGARARTRDRAVTNRLASGIAERTNPHQQEEQKEEG